MTRSTRRQSKIPVTGSSVQTRARTRAISGRKAMHIRKSHAIRSQPMKRNSWRAAATTSSTPGGLWRNRLPSPRGALPKLNRPLMMTGLAMATGSSIRRTAPRARPNLPRRRSPSSTRRARNRGRPAGAGKRQRGTASLRRQLTRVKSNRHSRCCETVSSDTSAGVLGETSAFRTGTV